ncbi:MAG: hypothetical protein GKR94_10530 [Gammaproteobacteria bacterium]|nr:hypothetical protein [Gammaproteobacteria bacterium]
MEHLISHWRTERPYVPVLKTKLGEANALKKLDPGVRRRVLPLLDFLPPPTSEYSPIALVNRISKAASNFARSLDGCPAVYVDTYDIPPACKGPSGRQAIEPVCESCLSHGMSVIPIVGLGRTLEHTVAVSKLPFLQKSGVGVRLEVEDLLNSSIVVARLENTLGRLQLDTPIVDLIFDLRSLVGQSEARLSALVSVALVDVARLGPFRSTTICGSNYPVDVSEIPKDGQAIVERRELAIWRRVVAAVGTVRMPRFGDYAVVHPDFVELGPVPNANAKIRYAFGDHWIVRRGHSLRESPNYEQYRDLSRDVADGPYFHGANCSYGDQYIADCAAGRVGTGNLGTWVSVDVNHHITATTELIVAEVQRSVAGIENQPL